MTKTKTKANKTENQVTADQTEATTAAAGQAEVTTPEAGQTENKTTGSDQNPKDAKDANPPKKTEMVTAWKIVGGNVNNGGKFYASDSVHKNLSKEFLAWLKEKGLCEEVQVPKNSK